MWLLGFFFIGERKCCVEVELSGRMISSPCCVVVVVEYTGIIDDDDERHTTTSVSSKRACGPRS